MSFSQLSTWKNQEKYIKEPGLSGFRRVIWNIQIVFQSCNTEPEKLDAETEIFQVQTLKMSGLFPGLIHFFSILSRFQLKRLLENLVGVAQLPLYYNTVIMMIICFKMINFGI